MPPDPSTTETPLLFAGVSGYLDEPVPDYGATLTTQAEQEAEDDNVNFLRTPMNDQSDTDSDDMRRRRRSPYMTASEFRHGQRDLQRRAMRRAVLHNRRYTPAQLQELGDSQESLPPESSSRPTQGYHGWAPGTSDNESDGGPETHTVNRAVTRHELEGYLDSATRRQMRELEAEAEMPSLRRHHSRDYGGSDWGSSHFVEDEAGAGESATTDSSLRTTALLQSVRRHTGFSARSRDQLQNYILERARRGAHLNEDSDFPGPLQQRYSEALSPYTQEYLNEQREQRTRMQALQRAVQDSSSASVPDATRLLEQAITFLERLRSCDTYSERLQLALEHRLKPGEPFTRTKEDFILDPTTIEPPQESSWLKVGGVFSGSQHAASHPSYHHVTSTRTHHEPSRSSRPASLSPYSSRLTATQNPRSSWITRETALRDPTSLRSAMHGLTSTSSFSKSEQWPVKVTIHSIDYDNMTLSGTMEAFNVPDPNSPSSKSSITTFLEGEIIDFNRYTLETKSFKADARTDGTYWRKLEPFKGLSESEIVKCLCSQRWLSEELERKWVLMRWKERCFVTPSDSESGLTISGFYYVSLRREDGRVEGLYYDPSSSPYQHLTLTPERGMKPAMFPDYSFR
ncbi:MAG: hypothetical protein MMC33_007278 [Icmadophila ericetorum]|nr:hypothetical protein [Icmadophila ericetorum]